MEKTATRTHKTLLLAYGYEIMSRAHVFEWIKRTKKKKKRIEKLLKVVNLKDVCQQAKTMKRSVQFEQPYEVTLVKSLKSHLDQFETYWRLIEAWEE